MFEIHQVPNIGNIKNSFKRWNQHGKWTKQQFLASVPVKKLKFKQTTKDEIQSLTTEINKQNANSNKVKSYISSLTSNWNQTQLKYRYVANHNTKTWKCTQICYCGSFHWIEPTWITSSSPSFLRNQQAPITFGLLGFYWTYI